jgi:FkbM family methyltransferase
MATSTRPLFWQALSPLLFRAAPRLRSWMRAPGARPLKRWIFRCFTDPYTNFRAETFETTAAFGARFRGTLSGLVQRSVFHFGEYEPNLTAFVREHLRPGDVFVDVGANVGYFSLLAARLVGEAGSVVAVEAAPSTFAALEANLARNGAVNVRAVDAAAFDRETTLPIYHIPSEENTGGASVVHDVGPQEALVRAAPLAALLGDAEIARARLIKIDVEGAEVAALRGLLPVIDRLPRDAQLIVETLRANVAEVQAILEPRGYAAHVLANPSSPLDLTANKSILVPLAESRAPREVSYLVYARGLNAEAARSLRGGAPILTPRA